MDRLSVAFFCLGFLLSAPLAAQVGRNLNASPGQSPAAPAGVTNGAVSAPQKLFGSIPVSTRSEEARKYLELSIDKYENGLLDDAAVHAQHAVEQDPRFVLGYAFLSYVSRETAPNSAALAKAKELLSGATPQEQMLVRWMTG